MKSIKTCSLTQNKVARFRLSQKLAFLSRRAMARISPQPWVWMMLVPVSLLFSDAQIVRGQTQPDTPKELAEVKTLHQQIEKLIEDEKYDEALPLALRALAIRERLLPAQHQEVAESLTDLGVVYLETRKLTEAQALLERALAIGENNLGKENVLLIEALQNVSDAYRAQNDAVNLEATLQRILAIREKALGPQDKDVATSLNSLALLYLSQGDYLRAEPLFQRAFTIRETVLGQKHPLYAQSLNNLAALYREKGEYARAEPLFKRALAFREASPGQQQLDLASSLNNLGGLYQLKGDYEQAEPLFKRALEIRGAARPESTLVAESLNNLALLYKQKKDLDQAEPLYQRALQIQEKLLTAEHSSVAQILNNLALVYMDKSNYAQAEPLLERALKIREKTLGATHAAVGESISNLGTVAFYRGEYAESESLHLKALAIFEKALGSDHPRTCVSRNNLAQIFVTNRKYTEAAELLSRNNESREKNLVPILSVGSEREKLSYLSTLSEETDFTVSFNARFSRANSQATRLALTRVLRLKGRVIDAMADSIGTLLRRANADDRKLIEQLSSARSQLAALLLRGSGGLNAEERRRNLARLEALVQQLETEVSARSAEFLAQSQTVTFARVQNALPKGAALIEIVLYRPFNPSPKTKNETFGAPRYAAYVFRKTGEPRLVALGSASRINQSVGRFRKALRGKKANVKQLARVVDKQVMQPLRAHLGKTRRVFLSPDSSLNLIPFAALVDEKGNYAVKQYRFTYLTSGRDLLRLQTRIKSKNAPILLADVNFDSGASAEEKRAVAYGPTIGDAEFKPLARLAASRREADEVKVALGEASVFTQDEATEAVLKKSSSPSILHVATHGFFLESEPQETNDGEEKRIVVRRTSRTEEEMKLENPMLRSGLFLAGANRRKSGDDDGVLTALEAAGLDLWGTRLVVLSACETGVGEVKNGDGVYGLRRALVLAGTETQMISLWPVSDSGTRDLMVDFYRQVQSGADRGEALREAQLKLLAGKRFSHPFYWASFIQSGDWRGLQIQAKGDR